MKTMKTLIEIPADRVERGLAALVKIQEEAVSAVRQALLAAEGRTGGYFCLADHAGRPLLTLGIGEIPDGKAGKYHFFAQRKAEWVGGDPGRKSSRQAGDPNIPPGAVRTKNYIFSFSGLTPELDETAMLVAAVECGELADEEAIVIAGKDGIEAQYTSISDAVYMRGAAC